MTDLPELIADPELAALVRRDPLSDEPTDAAPADTAPTSEFDVEAVTVLPLAAAVTDGEPPARPRRRRRLALLFGVSAIVGFVLTAVAPASCTHGATSTRAASCPASASAPRSSAGSPANRRRRRSGECL